MDAIVRKLSQTVLDFSEYINTLPLSDLALSRTVHWGPKEVLSHIVFWHEQYCTILSALLTNQKPQLLTGKFSDLNAKAVKKNKNKPTKELLQRLQVAQIKLEGLSKNPNAKKISIAFKDGGMLRPLRDALEKIEAHIRSHERQLKRAGFR